MQTKIREGTLCLSLQENMYSEAVLFKCFYWYGKAYSVTISRKESGTLLVLLEPKEKLLNNEDWQKVVDRIKQDLIDFKLRDIVTKETKVIRELLVAKAFAYYEIYEVPSTYVSDPVGFDPTKTALYD